MAKHSSFIIVGFGLAGACLARSFGLAGISFHVIDSTKKSKASYVAAGMFNPVVFRRLLKSWMVDELLPFARSFYQELEIDLNARFYFERDYYKIIGSKEADFWQQKAVSQEVADYIQEELQFPFNEKHLAHEYGAGKVFGAGNVQLNVFIEAYKESLIKRGQFTNADIDYSEIIATKDSVTVQNFSADKLIFCEGSHGIDNPWFQHLLYKLTKGEVLTIKVPDLNLEQMVNKNIFVLPLDNDLYRVGATYEWQDLSEEPTEKGRNSLTERLEKILLIPYEIIEHKAGIRPVLADRRPVLGFHPEHARFGIFNGLGTKGVMLAPYFSDQLVRHIISGAPLNTEVDLGRFYNL